MDWQYTLVETYVLICDRFSKELCVHAQRMSNNHCPVFTDEEVVTIYLFGTMQGHCQIKAIYDYTRNHLRKWFPHLPTYQTYVSRLSRLSYVFMKLTEHISTLAQQLDLSTKLVDSFPVVIANAKRSNRAKVAPKLADKGRCASKNMYFYGVKVHMIAVRKAGTLPVPEAIGLSKASVNDLTAARPIFAQMHNCRIFGDKIYSDQSLKEQLQEEQGVELHTPVKRKKGQEFLRSDQQLYSTLVSRVRQPIESLFNSIQEKTGIERASKVRSENGLLVHIFGKLAAAMLMIVLYS